MRRLAAFTLMLALAACGGVNDTGGGGSTNPVGFTQGIAFTRGGDIWVADSSDWVNKTQRLTTDQGNGQPALSPDGKLVAYVHTDTSGAASLYTVPSGGGTPSVLVAASSRAYAGLAFSHDGSTLYFAADHLLYRIQADGSGETALTTTGEDMSSPSVSTQGALFALDQTQGGFVQVTGGAVSLVYSAPSAARGAISPDGSQLAYEDSSTHEIMVFDAPGSAPRQLTSIPGAQQREPAWSTDGATIFFTSNAGGDDKIYSVPATATDSSGTLIQVGSQASYGG